MVAAVLESEVAERMRELDAQGVELRACQAAIVETEFELQQVHRWRRIARDLSGKEGLCLSCVAGRGFVRVLFIDGG